MAENRNDGARVQIMRTLTLVIGLCILLFVYTERSVALVGTEWQQWSEDDKRNYVMGVLEGWMAELLLAKWGKQEYGSDLSIAERIIQEATSCGTEKKMKWDQAAAIVQQYVNSHPAEWDEHMPFIIRNAMQKAYAGEP